MTSTATRGSGVVRRAALVWAAGIGGVAVWPVAGWADANYVGGAGVGNWSVPENWSPVGVPSTAATASMRNADELSRTLNYDYAGPAVKLGGVNIDQTGSGTSTLQIAGLTLTTSYTSAGFSGTGSVVQTGGTNASDAVWLGFNPGSRGTYSMSGGQLGGATSMVAAGWGGAGTFVHTGGTNAIQVLFVGYQASSSGTYQLGGSGSLSVSEWEEIGGGETTGSRGVFEQSGGTHAVKSMLIGGKDTGSGTYRLSGDGSLAAGTYLGVGRNGRFEQTGGTIKADAVMSIAGTTAAPAVYSISAGELVVRNLEVGESTGGATGAGTMNVSGGSVAAPANLGVTRNGVLNLSGGTVTSPMFGNAGLVTATGGAFTGAMGNTGTLRVGGGSTFDITFGLRGSSGGTAVGRLVLDAGGTVVANSVFQESLEMNGPTANPPMPGPVLSIRRKADGGATSLVRSLTVQADENGRPVGRIDLADNALVVDYAGASPIANVRSLIRAAWAGGTWTGNGLGSSAAAANAAMMGLGYGEASVVVGAGGGTFEGQPVDATAVVIKYAVQGDATLDGVVNFDDLLALAKHYNRTDGVWADGDFGYDGVVNFDDLLVLAKHYNQVMPAGAALDGVPAADVAAAFAQAAVPEPGAVGVMVGAALVLGRRRQR